MIKLIDKIVEEKAKVISVVGLAKNTGKTVTFNTIIKECVDKKIKPALVSFGRDGEATDALTLLEKPKIIIPPYTYFVTAERYINPSMITIKDEISTGISTVFGEAKVYSTGAQGGMVELIGINTLKNLSIVLSILKKHSDIVLVDGALDRKSSAVPTHSEATIMATGAVLGMTEDDVVEKTNNALKKFRVPVVEDEKISKKAKELFDKGLSGCETSKNEILEFKNINDAINETITNKNVKNLFIHGAITNMRMQLLEPIIKKQEIKIIIKDGTRVFLDKKYLNRLHNGKLNINVLHPIKIIAITVNPTRPFFADMSSDLLIREIKKIYPSHICCNVMSDYYLELA